jgi:hypothetical protein
MRGFFGFGFPRLAGLTVICGSSLISASSLDIGAVLLSPKLVHSGSSSQGLCSSVAGWD